MGKKYSFLNHLLQLNLAMLLVSTSGVLGRSIPLWAPIAIAYRALLAAALLFLFLRFKKINLFIAKKDRKMILLGGILMGLHWVFYFEALQLSSVAIGMLTIYTHPTLTSILEPIIMKKPFQKIHLLLGILVLAGITFLVPELDLENQNTQAVGFGLVSALCYSLRNILMKKQIENYHGSLLMWYQMVIVATGMLPFYFMATPDLLTEAFPYLLTLALVTTAIGHTLYLMSFKYFNITTASILGSVQPIYGILMGIFILGEIPRWGTFIGGGMILIAVITESLRSLRKRKKEQRVARIEK
ncbi:MAG TPA: EamA/RhaT family transporter [Leeuwenhoekiella sp.]|nr:EamA/RhaT family transporter [Leeuwenhoekiella sp.]